MRYPFSEGKLTGYIDETGRVAIKPKHFAGGTFVHGVAHTSGHNEHVFIDQKGKILFRVPQMTHYEPFGPDGLAYFGRWDPRRNRYRGAFRDVTGKETALEVDEATSPREGLAAARSDSTKERWGYIDRRGRFVIAEQFARARPFFEGRAAVTRKIKWGFIDKTGAVLVPFKYDGVTDFIEGLASVCVGEDWGSIDANGKRVLAPKWKAPLAFRRGISPACEKPLSFGAIDREGRFFGAARFLALHPFDAGAAGARDPKTKRWGIVAPDGTWIAKPKFESLGPFVGPLAHFTRHYSRTRGKSKYGYIDAAGNIVFEYVD